MSWIELAPRHKMGLPIALPVMPAAGAFGYGDAYRGLIDETLLGAVVTHPVSPRPRHAAQGTRLATRGPDMVIHTGWPNPGVRAVIREYTPLWERLTVPVIVHLLATTPAETSSACAQLSRVRGVGGIELGLRSGTAARDALTLLEAAEEDSEVPIIVRVPFADVERLAMRLARAGADALTLTAPPRAILPVADEEEPGALTYVRGRLYSRSLFPLLLELLSQWVRRLNVPVLACGGIATPEEARACLALGAAAVQIDALLWREPALLTRIATTLAADAQTTEISEERYD